MKIVCHDPTDGIYPASGGYVHAVELIKPERLLFTSGTMGLDRNWKPPLTIDKQLSLAWDNIRTILKSADMTTENVVRLTSYLAHREFSVQNASARREALNGRHVPTTVIVVGTLEPGWLVELEVVAAA